jgi:hypothetical protein
MSIREERIGRNEALFRQVNERLEDLNRAFSVTTETVQIVCECGHLECVERITMPLASYEQLRSDPTQFAVVHGHQIEDVEDVVAEFDTWSMLRKKAGDPAEIARELDPRSA